MGSCQSQAVNSTKKISKAIDRQLQSEHAANMGTKKLLLLGASCSGKSTILKQMRILHDNGFSAEELKQLRYVVYSNVIQSMHAIVMAMAQFGITPETACKQTQVLLDVMKQNEESERFSPKNFDALKRLWADAGVQKCLDRKSEFHLMDSAEYFLSSLDRIAMSDYRPTEQDILHARIKTTGIIQIAFTINEAKLKVFDVGGQRSERRKWIHCFEDVHAIIFIASLSEFDQRLAEDPTVNAMLESIKLFESICNSRWFTETSMILFLNKKDLFEEELKHATIKTAFPEYSGPPTYEESAAYIEQKFLSENKNEEKMIYVHRTCATDTNQIQLVLENVIDVIRNKNTQGSGLY